jgi:hypothetical protein
MAHRPRWRSGPAGGLRGGLRGGLGAALLALALVPSWQAPAQAAASGCRAWGASRGEERIRLGNSLGAAHYLTKTRRLQTSTDDAPVSLYRESDLRRLCDDRR